jgi:hypothetical protein
MSDLVKVEPEAIDGDYQAPGEFKKQRHFWTQTLASIDLADRLRVWSAGGCRGPRPTADNAPAERERVK